MKIADFELGSGKTFIVAELSANHNGDLDLACKTIASAAKAGFGLQNHSFSSKSRGRCC